MSIAVSQMEGTSQRLQADVRNGTFCAGVQVYVSRGDEVLLDAAFGRDGLGRPMTTDTLSAVYCTIKPMISVLVLLAEQNGELRRETRLGELLEVDHNTELAAVTLEDLLTQRAGMHTVPTLLAGFKPPAVRHELAMSSLPPEGWDRSTDAAYSEWLGFYLIGQALQRVTGVKLPDLLRERLLDALDIAADVSLGVWGKDLERIG